MVKLVINKPFFPYPSRKAIVVGLRSLARVFIKRLNQIFNGNKSTAQMQVWFWSVACLLWRRLYPLLWSTCYFGKAYRIWLKHYLNAFSQPPSGAISMHIHLHSFYVYTNGSCSDKTVRISSLVWTLAVCICDMYHLMNWLILIPMLKRATIKLFLGLCVCAYVWWSLVDNHRDRLIRNLFGHSFIQFHLDQQRHRGRLIIVVTHCLIKCSVWGIWCLNKSFHY